MMVVEEKNTQSFAANSSNFANHIQQCFACDTVPNATHGHFAYENNNSQTIK